MNSTVQRPTAQRPAGRRSEARRGRDVTAARPVRGTAASRSTAASTASTAAGVAPPRTEPRPSTTDPRPAPSTPSRRRPPGTRPGTAPSGRPRTRPPSDARRRQRGRQAPAAGAPRTPFVLLVVGLLGGALVSLLLLNTVLAKDAFTLTELQRGNKALNQRQQALEEEIARADSPEVLAKRARELGMVPATTPRFVSVNGDRPGRPGGSPRGALATAGAAGVVGLPPAAIGAAGAPASGRGSHGPVETRPSAGREGTEAGRSQGRSSGGTADQSAFGG